MMKKILLFALLCSLATGAFAQNKKKAAGALSKEGITTLAALEDTLGVLGYAVVNDSAADMRFLACRALITTLVRGLKTENSFKYPFEQLKMLSIQAPPDSSFRLFTWQLFVDDSTYRYFGAIQMNTRELTLFPLIDRSFEMTSVEFDELSADRWYGCLYYNIVPFQVSKKERKYLLFGFDGFSFFNRRKVIDVLSFDETGTPVFGAEVFDKPVPQGAGRPLPAQQQKRVVIEYASESNVRCNYDNQYKMVIYDHLIPVPANFHSGIAYVTDGSYEGYKLEKGRWKYVEKVFNDYNETPVRPEPILDARKNKTITGTERKLGKKSE